MFRWLDYPFNNISVIQISRGYRDFNKKGKKNPGTLSGVQRAIDGARTRGLHLGKVALYQLSYYRVYVAIATVTTN